MAAPTITKDGKMQFSCANCGAQELYQPTNTKAVTQIKKAFDKRHSSCAKKII